MPYSAHQEFPLLNSIESPADLRRCRENQLPLVAEQLRRYLVSSVAKTGGHLAAGLGVVELTIALHYIFNTPEDRLVWDVGHQAYPHKILTGRRTAMAHLRQQGGISGFVRREESPYDTFGVGHSSTSISAALGMALAARAQGVRRETIAVIGDGALTAGMAFEAMNHAGSIKDIDLLVILNDNAMSISPPVGAVRNYLARLLSGPIYTGVRSGGKQALSLLPPLKELIGRWEEHMKGMVMPSTLFEEMGFNYIGPIDGHDLPTLLATLRNMRGMGGCRFLHVVTQKGRGYSPAEEDPCGYHGVSPFQPTTGAPLQRPQGRTYTQVFGDWLIATARQDSRLVAITPAMIEGSGLGEFARLFPQRCFDVGIAEQHAMTLAAGLACEGLKPVAAFYSTFLQRAYDQLVHDVALQNLDVTLAVDRAGLVGPDGATHAGVFDLAYARCLPNLLIMTPGDADECQRLLTTAYQHPGPALVRYPRAKTTDRTGHETLPPLPIGKAECRRTGTGTLALLAFGPFLEIGAQLADRLDASLFNMRFVKPLDLELLRRLSLSQPFWVTLEEHAVQGGAGSAINEAALTLELKVNILNLGIPDRFIEHATREEQWADCGLDADSLEQRIRAWLERQHHA